MNTTEFSSEDIFLTNKEKGVLVLLWILIQGVGTPLLIGLVQFERLSGDPLKRRVVDQVKIYYFLTICLEKIHINMKYKSITFFSFLPYIM